MRNGGLEKGKAAAMLTLTAWVVFLLLGPVKALAQRLPDTGQDKCYDNAQEIPCPQPGEAFYGQDAQYHGPQMAYQDNGDGTVTDLNTNLTWQQGDSQNTVARLWQDAVDYCDGLSLGGHSDWRLPTIQELSSLIDYSKPYPGPTIDTGYFPNCRQYRYWSGSTNAVYPDDAWYVDFHHGYVIWDFKGCYYYVRCVRGGP